MLAALGSALILSRFDWPSWLVEGWPLGIAALAIMALIPGKKAAGLLGMLR